VLAVFACLGLSICSGAETITLFAVADATLIEISPSNSIGAASWIAAGTTQNGNSNRALIKFDVSAAIPAGSTIIDAGVSVWVTRQPVDGYDDSIFSLRRVLRPWGEGANPGPAQSPGLGLPAQPGDATWSHCFWGTNAWSIPGGQEGVDYSDNISTTTSIEGARDERYFFEAGGTIADVQYWVQHPESNFGWMLKTEEELSIFTARRFGSRELQDPEASPQLTVTYLPPILLAISTAPSNRVTLTFNAEVANYYRIESCPALLATNAWTVLTNYGLVLSSGPLTATDTNNGAQRFYRVRQE
jgi:hypothetical protein